MAFEPEASADVAAPLSNIPGSSLERDSRALNQPGGTYASPLRLCKVGCPVCAELAVDELASTSYVTSPLLSSRSFPAASLTLVEAVPGASLTDRASSFLVLVGAFGAEPTRDPAAAIFLAAVADVPCVPIEAFPEALFVEAAPDPFLALFASTTEVSGEAARVSFLLVAADELLASLGTTSGERFVLAETTWEPDLAFGELAASLRFVDALEGAPLPSTEAALRPPLPTAVAASTCVISVFVGSGRDPPRGLCEPTLKLPFTRSFDGSLDRPLSLIGAKPNALLSLVDVAPAAVLALTVSDIFFALFELMWHPLLELGELARDPASEVAGATL